MIMIASHRKYLTNCCTVVSYEIAEDIVEVKSLKIIIYIVINFFGSEMNDFRFQSAGFLVGFGLHGVFKSF
jgi:hypothetical protein